YKALPVANGYSEGCPSDPCDLEIMKLPISADGRVLSADDFFQKIMDDTKTEIKYPKFLKVGARNKKVSKNLSMKPSPGIGLTVLENFERSPLEFSGGSVNSMLPLVT
ncbi:hypothetical protein OTU49_007501, partial [Cherax quadricarinatus]